MRAPLSMVIPTLNAAAALGPTLAALTQGATEGLIRELVISDGGSRDAVAAIAEEVGATFVNGPAGRGAQLARGARAASGEWLLFLHADTRLGPDWIRAARAHIEAADASGAPAAVFRLAFDHQSFGARWVAGWANLRTRLFALPFGDQGLLISRRLYDAVGGYPEIPIMEDVALARRLGRSRLTLLDATATTSAERYLREGWFKRGARNWHCLALFFLGVPPERIARIYSDEPRR